MLSQSTRQAMQQKARMEAAAAKKVPYMVADEDLTEWRQGRGFPLPFPFIGDHEPPGYEPTRELFVDTSGFGADDEPALSMRQLLEALQADRCYAFTEVGQFQAYLQEYRSRVYA